ncbi:MAG: HAD family phosphatase [Hyphomicrobiaceae bacterium]|nr:HAD family phosphatase [Hyphomicrobiaceae bacterium]MCC0022703.1 HAD family phosphatase [Hyphomicrobiaceae bacterium]
MTAHLTPVFDIGNVFMDWNPMYLFRKLFETEEQARWFHDNVCTHGWNLEFDRGKPYFEGISEKIAEFPKFWREIEAFDSRWIEMTRGLYHSSADIQDELIALGHKTYAITNFSAEKWRLVLPEWAFFQKFDGIVVSGNEGLVKPDPAIFELFLDRFGLVARECLFIDDNAANIVSAKQLGFETIHLTDPKTLRADLIGFGFDLRTEG